MDIYLSLSIYLSIYPSIYLWLYSPSLDLGNFFRFVIFFTQTVGLLGQCISPSRGRYLHTDIHASSGIRTHDPSVQASEDGSCLRARSRPLWSASMDDTSCTIPPTRRACALIQACGVHCKYTLQILFVYCCRFNFFQSWGL
jgi:hypothetical protein